MEFFDSMSAMGATILVILFGSGSVLLGRWLYRQPNKLVPGWGVLNPENPGVKKLARGYATFMIFFGTIACAGSILVLVGLKAFAPLASLAAGVAGAWFFRPQLQQVGPTSSQPAALKEGETGREEPLLSKNWKRALMIIAGLVVLLTAAINVVITDSEVSKVAFARAQANPILKTRLGEPIKRGLFMSGNIEVSGPSGHADIEIPISGPKGKATLYAVARKSADVWNFDTLEAAIHDGGERVDLLKKPTDPGQPPTE
jgi:hypothetical protein